MPRKLTMRTNLFPYHVTSRSNHQEWFALPMSDVWEIAVTALKHANSKHPIILHAFVLMSNHYHLVLETPEANIDRFMYEFNKSFSLEMRKRTGKINRMFGGRYKWSVITEESYYLNVIKYVFTNPLRAQVVHDVRLYPYSTLNRKIDFIPQKKIQNWNDERWINWMQAGFNDHQRQSIKSGLKNIQFKFANIATIKRPPLFELPP